MIKATTIGTLKNGEEVVLAGLAVPVHKHKELFRQLTTSGGQTEKGPLKEVYCFFSNGLTAKKRIFHARPKRPKAIPEGFVSNLADLATALNLTELALKEARDASPETFPPKSKEGYNVAAYAAWLEGDA